MPITKDDCVLVRPLAYFKDDERSVRLADVYDTESVADIKMGARLDDRHENLFLAQELLGREVVVKRYPRADMGRLLRDADVLRRIGHAHPNIMQADKIVVNGSKVAKLTRHPFEFADVIMPRADRTLADVSQEDISAFVPGIVEGLRAIASMNIYHTNLRKQHVLICDSVPRLTDFADAIVYTNTTFVNPVRFFRGVRTPPEMLVAIRKGERTKYSSATFAWSVGVFLLELCGYEFPEETDIAASQRFWTERLPNIPARFKLPGPDPETVPLQVPARTLRPKSLQDRVVDLALSFLRWNPTDRASVSGMSIDRIINFTEVASFLTSEMEFRRTRVGQPVIREFMYRLVNKYREICHRFDPEQKMLRNVVIRSIDMFIRFLYFSRHAKFNDFMPWLNNCFIMVLSMTFHDVAYADLIQHNWPNTDGDKDKQCMIDRMDHYFTYVIASSVHWRINRRILQSYGDRFILQFAEQCSDFMY